MNRRWFQFLLALLPGVFLPQVVTAHLGDSVAQLEARYGAPVPDFFGEQVNQAGSEMGGRKVQFLYFETNDWRIAVMVDDDKTRFENYYAPTNDPYHTDEYYVKLAQAVSGHTNWIELSGYQSNSVWVADYSQMEIERGPNGPDNVGINAEMQDAATQKREYDQEVREAQLERINAAANPTGSLDPKAAMDARIMASQQALADKGDPYGERMMGLRYRDGNGVTADVAKARELLQKAADQGDKAAQQALDSIKGITLSTEPASEDSTNAPQITIDSAIFAWGNKSADVTQKVIDRLHESPDGFTVDRGTLGTDPAPGKKKILTVIYEYNGRSHTIKISGGNDLSYSAMIDHATKHKSAE